MENGRQHRLATEASSELRNGRATTPRADVVAQLDLVHYWSVVKPWWRRIVGITAVAIMLTVAMDSFVRTQWYRANATIRAASQETTSPLITMMGSPLLGGGLSSLMAGTGLGSTPSDVAEEMAIMSSFDFVVSLVERHRLEPMLERTSVVQQILRPIRKAVGFALSLGRSSGRATDRRWRWYRDMKGRFSTSFDDREGNLLLTFDDPEPAVARRVLGFYLDDLREKLRSRAIRDAKAAAESLEMEMGKTTDPLIHTQIATLIAQQIQQEKTAEVQASFAFTVIEPPVVSDEVYRPNVKVDCTVVAILTAGLVVLILLGRATIANLAQRSEELAEDREEDEPSAAARNGIEPSSGDSRAGASPSR